MAESVRHYLTNTSDPDDPLIVIARKQHEAVARFSRQVGEQPEPAPLSPSASCPFCEQYPCTNRVHFVERFRTQ